jgi:hypothetical protein
VEVRGWRGALTCVALLSLVAPIFAPQLLAFPYRAVTPIGTVWSERPISREVLVTTSATVQARMATTPLAEPDERRLIFLTDGGWRWSWLTQRQSSFAISRPFTKAVIVNRTNVVGDAAMRRSTNGRKRTLASLLAHEFTHGLIRRRYGVARSLVFPVWKVEGYCDHVAGESTLDAGAVAKLEAAHQSHPALIYYRGRERVEAELARNGGNVDALFSGT